MNSSTELLDRALELSAWRVEWTPQERRAWSPPDARTVAEWAESERILPANSYATEPGRLSFDRTPYLREPVDSFGRRGVESITIMFPPQSGKSEAATSIVSWIVAQNPGAVLWVVPRQKDVRYVAEDRLRPAFRATPATAAELDETDAGSLTAQLECRRCTVYVRSAMSPADLAAVPAPFVIGDEADKWPKGSGREASPWLLARKRAITFQGRARFLLVSTPTTPGGLIYQEWARGDRRAWNVPCPHCGVFGSWPWESIRWPEELESDPDRLEAQSAAWIECPECKGRIEESAKLEANLRGVWVPDGAVFDRATGTIGDHVPRRHRSYHLPAWFSPWVSISQCAAAWLRQRDDEEGRRDFTNAILSMPFREIVREFRSGQVGAHVRGYARDEVPPGVVVLVAGIDVQKASMPYVIRGFGIEGESWLIRSGEARTWEGLSAIMQSSYGPKRLRVVRACIDSRNRRDEVIDFVRELAGVAVPIAGVKRRIPQLFTTTKIDRHPRTGVPLRGSILIWNVAVDAFRDRLGEALASESEGGSGAWHLHAGVTDAYLRQLVAMHKVKPRGKPDPVWLMRPGYKAEHYFDCEVYALVAAYQLRADRIPNPAKAKPDAPKPRGEEPRGERGRRSEGDWLEDLGGFE